MKFKFSTYTATVALLAALALPVQLAAQSDNQKQHHYKLIDLGTFGVPDSSTQDELEVLNSRVMIAGRADTSIPNHANACLFCSYPFISHAFRWRIGVLQDLGDAPRRQQQ